MRRSKRKFRKRGKFYRLNHFIQAPRLRLLDESGKQIGVVTKEEALRRARDLGVDVVEIAAKADPPVAKLIDFKKFKYLESKKEREQKKDQKKVKVKEIRLSPFIAEHDLQVRVEQGKAFLKEGNQLKISIPFRGRQITRKQFGFDVLNKYISQLSDVKIVSPAHFEGRVLVSTLAPDKSTTSTEKKHENQSQNKKDSS